MKNVIVKTVDDEKVYKCPYCGKESRYGQIMQSHMYLCDKIDAEKYFIAACEDSLLRRTVVNE